MLIIQKINLIFKARTYIELFIIYVLKKFFENIFKF
jgi:hypothetical protein